MGNMIKQPPNWEYEWKRNAKRDVGIGVFGLAARLVGINAFRGVTSNLAIKQSDLLKIPKNVGLIYYEAITKKLEGLGMTAEAFNSMEINSQIPYLRAMNALAKIEIEKSYFHDYRDILGSDDNESFFEEMQASFNKSAKWGGKSVIDYINIIYNIEANIVNIPYFTRKQIQDKWHQF